MSFQAAEELWRAGRYYEARAAYAHLVPDQPLAQLRLGMIYVLRGERGPAERAIRSAMQRGLSNADYQLALLYLGRALADDGRSELATRTWLLLEACHPAQVCRYRAVARLLTADLALTEGSYAQARIGLQAALAEPLPVAWAHYARYRLAILEAATDPQAALGLLAPPTDTNSEWRMENGACRAALPDALNRQNRCEMLNRSWYEPQSAIDPWLDPLLPTVGHGPEELHRLLATPPEQRSQLLGQFYMAQGFPHLAEAQVAALSRDRTLYAAVARWRTNGNVQELEALATTYPDQWRMGLLLTMAYLKDNADAAATHQLEILAKTQPATAELELVRASWHLMRGEYEEAHQAYQRALDLAPVEHQGDYALLVARFHLSTTYELCSGGLRAAEIAARARPDDATTLSLLAAYRYYCDQPAAAAQAADVAWQAGAGAEAAYYLGLSLASLGERQAAREALIRAADQAPASAWRQRAELALMALR